MPQAQAAALFNEHQNDLIETARAHAELLQWEAFTRALHRVEDPGTRQVLTWVRDLFGLCLLEKNLAWYLMNGRLSAQRARTLSPYINRLLAKIRPHSLDLVDAFGYGPEHVRAVLATGVEQERQQDAAAHARARRASSASAVDEKTVLARQGAQQKKRGKAAPRKPRRPAAPAATGV